MLSEAIHPEVRLKRKLKTALAWALWLIAPIDAGGMFFLALTSKYADFCAAFALTGTLSVLIAQKTSPESIHKILFKPLV